MPEQEKPLKPGWYWFCHGNPAEPEDWEVVYVGHEEEMYRVGRIGDEPVQKGWHIFGPRLHPPQEGKDDA